MLTADQITALAHSTGDVRHTDCKCCEHAARRTVGLREAIANAIRSINAGYAMEETFDLDRVLCCLNDWCNEAVDSDAHVQEFYAAQDAKVPF